MRKKKEDLPYEYDVDDIQALRERYAKYITAWEKRDRREQEELQSRAEQAGKAARRCAQLLAERYQIKRVWLIGSLLQRESFHNRSDIDLAVEGLAERKYFDALVKLYQMIPPGLELDLITLETAQPALRKHILATGRLLYEQQ